MALPAVKTHIKELGVALEAVITAARVVSAAQTAIMSKDILTKEDDSPVTSADIAAQAIISHRLEKDFPGFRMIAEETATEMRSNPVRQKAVMALVHSAFPSLSTEAAMDAVDRGGDQGGPKGTFWTLDPIDGTKGFLRGDQYCIALSLITDGKVQLGILACPNLPLTSHEVVRPGPDDKTAGTIMAAVEGSGSWISSLPLKDDAACSWTRVSASSSNVDLGSGCYVEGVEPAHSKHDVHAAIAKKLGITAPPVRMDSQCKYAVVGRKSAHIYLRLTHADYRDKIWDHAPGAVIVTEAGGFVSNLNGSPVDFSHGRFLNTGGGLITSCVKKHSDVVDGVAAVYTPSAPAAPKSGSSSSGKK